MFFITYTFKGQVHVFAGRVKIVSHSFCRTSAILKYAKNCLSLPMYMYMRLPAGCTIEVIGS